MPYKLSINGKTLTADVEPDTPLLWVLRDTLNMPGTKYGCGIGECGACTVHMNGALVKSCQMNVSDVGDKAITTIEGISANKIGAIVQKAWIDHDVVQCGYCQGGMIMAATALLTRTPKPTDEQIDRAMNSNICRCATYVRIKSAIRQAAGLAPEMVEPPAPQLITPAVAPPVKS